MFWSLKLVIDRKQKPDVLLFCCALLFDWLIPSGYSSSFLSYRISAEVPVRKADPLLTSKGIYIWVPATLMNIDEYQSDHRIHTSDGILCVSASLSTSCYPVLVVILISLAATCRAPWVLSLQNCRVRTRPARGTIRKALKLAFEDNSTYQLASYMTEKS